MISIVKRLEWDSAHRVLRHESKCGTLHGHRYAAELEVTADELDSCGRVVDFSVIKTEVGAWIDKNWDHTTLVNTEDVNLMAFCSGEFSKGKRAPYRFPGEPTAENIARVLFERAAMLLAPHNVKVVAVTIYETPTSRATYKPGAA